MGTYTHPRDAAPTFRQWPHGPSVNGLAGWWSKEVWGKWSISSVWTSITRFWEQGRGEGGSRRLLQAEKRDEGGKGEERRRIL